MVNKKLVCTSCKTEVTNQVSITFKCPKCSKQDITRCAHCREIAAKYTCSCGFSGPN